MIWAIWALVGCEPEPMPERAVGWDSAAGAEATALSTGPRRRYRGITTATIDGASGLSAMNATCGAEFPDSRVCADMEVFSVTPPVVPGADAWVLFTVATSISDGTYLMNPIGLRTQNAYVNCGGAITGGELFTGLGRGLILDANGEFTQGICSTSYAVACCGG